MGPIQSFISLYKQNLRRRPERKPFSWDDEASVNGFIEVTPISDDLRNEIGEDVRRSETRQRRVVIVTLAVLAVCMVAILLVVF